MAGGVVMRSYADELMAGLVAAWEWEPAGITWNRRWAQGQGKQASRNHAERQRRNRGAGRRAKRR